MQFVQFVFQNGIQAMQYLFQKLVQAIQYLFQNYCIQIDQKRLHHYLALGKKLSKIEFI